MCWACFEQVGWTLVWNLVARFLGVPLEWRLHTPSISCPYKTSAGVFSTLEQVSLRSSSRARVGTLALARVVLFGVSSGRGKSTLERTGFRARAGVLYSCVLELERDFLRSSVPSFLFLTLERCVLHSSGNVVYQLATGHFKITFYILSLSNFLKTLLRASLSRISLLSRVWSS